jgi:hypothetical protein
MKSARFWARSVLVAAGVVALMVPAVPVAAAEASWSLTTNPITIRRDGKAYQMSISVFESEGSESLSVRLWQERDPSGVTRSTQSHTFSFQTTDKFDHAATLATAGVTTNRALGEYGSVNVDFAKNAATQTSCNGHLKTRTGTLSGSVSIKTGTSLFGTITNRPGRATLSFSDGDCGLGGSDGGGQIESCPSSGKNASGFRSDPSMILYASRANGANFSNVGVVWSEPLSVDGSSLIHSIDARVAAAKVNIADNLGSGSVSGASGTWLSGTATFSPTGEPFASPAQPCGSGREYVQTTRPGAWSGGFKADFWLGPDRSVGQGPVSGSATKTSVRDR